MICPKCNSTMKSHTYRGHTKARCPNNQCRFTAQAYEGDADEVAACRGQAPRGEDELFEWPVQTSTPEEDIAKAMEWMDKAPPPQVVTQKDLDHLYIGLHSKDGTETNYPGYGRVAVKRDAEHWTVSEDGTAKNAKAIRFPECTGGHGLSVDSFAVYDSNGDELVKARLTNSLALGSYIIPQFDRGDLSIDHDAMVVVPQPEVEPGQVWKWNRKNKRASPDNIFTIESLDADSVTFSSGATLPRDRYLFGDSHNGTWTLHRPAKVEVGQVWKLYDVEFVVSRVVDGYAHQDSKSRCVTIDVMMSLDSDWEFVR